MHTLRTPNVLRSLWLLWQPMLKKNEDLNEINLLIGWRWNDTNKHDYIMDKIFIKI
jgi:hypothetical protein